MIVGGREFNERRIDVEQAMLSVEPESIQKYAVEINGLNYPPKQVLATVTGWERTSFTTMEAQRVLRKLGFNSDSVAVVRAGRREFKPVNGNMETVPTSDTSDRLAALESSLATAQEAIAGLSARVRALEST